MKPIIPPKTSNGVMKDYLLEKYEALLKENEELKRQQTEKERLLTKKDQEIYRMSLNIDTLKRLSSPLKPEVDVDTEEQILNLKYELLKLKNENDEMHTRLNRLIETTGTLSRMIFATKSEKLKVLLYELINSLPEEVRKQFPFFDDVVESGEKDTKDSKSTPRKPKSEHGDDSIAKRTPDRTVVLNQTGGICPECGTQAKKITENTKKVLDVKEIIEVIEYITSTYKCEACGTIFRDEIPENRKNIVASDNTLAKIVRDRVKGSIPFERQSRLLGYANRKTITNWFYTVADYLKPMSDRIAKEMLKVKCLHIDETPTLVLKLKKVSRLGYIVTQVSGKYEIPLVVIRFSNSRSREALLKIPRAMESDCTLISDAYGAYKSEGNIKSAKCMAHARREFVKIQKSSKTNPYVDAVIALFAKLYAIEAEIKDMSIEERTSIRRAKSTEVCNKLFEMFGVLVTKFNGQPLGKASKYCINHWLDLTVFLERGNIDIDNNAAERSLRPWVMSRHSSLFTHNEETTNKMTDLYTIVQTCEANQLDVTLYIKHLLAELSDYNPKKSLEHLTPWSPEMQERFKKK